MFNGRPFPVHVFPQIIRNAVYEAEQQTQAPQALICVGKKAGAHSVAQEETNNLLVSLALSGKKVCRLKGGDPFIFGRGADLS